MKHIIALAILSCLCINVAFAQSGPEARIKTFRKQFFEKELQLSEAEAEKFWPLYDAMKEEEKDLKKSMRAGQKPELMSDDEVEKYILNSFELEEKQISLKRKYFEKYKDVLPIRKVAMISRTEKEFKKALVRRLRGRNRGGDFEGNKERKKRREGFNN